MIDFSLFDNQGNQFGETGSITLNFVGIHPQFDPERLYKYYPALVKI